MGTENKSTPLEVVDFLNIQKIKEVEQEFGTVIKGIEYVGSKAYTHEYIITALHKNSNRHFKMVIKEDGMYTYGLYDTDLIQEIWARVEPCYTGMNSES